MKAIFLSCTFCAFSFLAMAQLPVGKTVLGGNLNYYEWSDLYPSGENRHSGIWINPVVGKVVSADKVKGISLSYGRNFNQQSPTPRISNHSIHIAAFQQRFLPLVHSFMVFGEGRAGDGYGWTKDFFKEFRLNAGIGGGIAYNVNNKFLFTFGYPQALQFFSNYGKTNNPSTSYKYTGFSAGITTSSSLPHFGFMLML